MARVAKDGRRITAVPVQPRQESVCSMCGRMPRVKAVQVGKSGSPNFFLFCRPCVEIMSDAAGRAPAEYARIPAGSDYHESGVGMP